MTFFGLSLHHSISLRPSRKLAVVAVALLTGTAMAGTITTYIGTDSGSPVGGPMPNSAAAQTAFLAAAGALGTVSTITFESLPVDNGASAVNVPLAAAPGVTIYSPGTNYNNFGFPGYTGVSNTTAGNGSNNNLYGYNTTAGGANFFGVTPGGATFTFASPITAFGLYATGLQTQFTNTLTFTFNDGTAQTIVLPINAGGGASYFGFTDTTAFRSITLTDVGNDAWAIDDVSSATSPVPEPGSLALLATGLLGVAGVARRRFLRS